MSRGVENGREDRIGDRDTTSASFAESITEVVIQFGDGIDLGDGRLHGVGNASEGDGAIFPDHVTRIANSIPGLADTSHVDHDLFATDLDTSTEVLGREKPAGFGEDARDMRMSLKTDAWDQAEQAAEFSRIVDVFGKDIFIERVACRAVDEEQAALTNLSRQFTEEIPTAARLFDVRVLFELIPGPKNGTLGPATESLGVVQRPLIVIPQHTTLEAECVVDAFPWIGAVPDHVPEAVNFANTLVLDVIENRFQGFQVPMDVGNDRAFHPSLVPHNSQHETSSVCSSCDLRTLATAS
jgi:hypothetical protein